MTTTTQTCTYCHKPIPAGEAVIRTRSLERVAWHVECYNATQPVRIPVQPGRRAVRRALRTPRPRAG